IVFLCLGANDYLRGGYKDIGVLEEKLDKLINIIKARNHEVILAGIGLPITQNLWDNFSNTGSLFNIWIKGTDEFLKLYPKIAEKHKLKFVASILEPIPQKSLMGSISAAGFMAAKDIKAGDLLYALGEGVFNAITGGVTAGLNTAHKKLSELALKVDINKI